MSSQEPRLRGSAPRRNEPYPLGQFPDEALREIGRQIVHRIAVGHADITGDDFGAIFADAIGGTHRNRPLGIADVVLDGTAWSVKTVKSAHPFSEKRVRLISGRNSPDYSQNIQNPHEDPAATGRAVIGIWNARINEALDEHNELRIVVMVRDFQTRQFVLFEEEGTRFAAGDFRWEFNKNNNLVGHNQADGTHQFTWQPHGSQFTIHRHIPGSARRFSINRNIQVVTIDEILAKVEYNEGWITIHGKPSLQIPLI